MKLLTYNFLTSSAIKGVKVGYPLKLHVLSQREVPSDYNAEFLVRMIPRLEWLTVLEGAKAIGYIDKLPLEIPQTFSNDTDFLQKLHHVLFEIDITDGYLECPETGRKFTISNGIPNMLLNEDEV
ncbi:multifunctional methyltransferase subunit TRM112-like protein isoform X2 [Sitodiplosis mosellana]|uniref:multifunctional methyltransferase subunit TRM112-like protein isoform X2 n=1 Tax=Sitodiplosis mosellana TaxID=263140 RepID=UPI0024448324|nr:multifunctional methyltransferase subunit TRM112-like protein isoform X2 [Sitodiplosis mosellana]